MKVEASEASANEKNHQQKWNLYFRGPLFINFPLCQVLQITTGWAPQDSVQLPEKSG